MNDGPLRLLPAFLLLAALEGGAFGVDPDKTGASSPQTSGQWSTLDPTVSAAIEAGLKANKSAGQDPVLAVKNDAHHNYKHDAQQRMWLAELAQFREVGKYLDSDHFQAFMAMSRPDKDEFFRKWDGKPSSIAALLKGNPAAPRLSRRGDSQGTGQETFGAAMGGKVDLSSERGVDYHAAQYLRARYPDDVQVRRFSAVESSKAGDHARAREDARFVLQNGQADAGVLTAYASSSYHLKDYAEARRAAVDALRLDPKSPGALAVLKLAESHAPQARPLPMKEGLFGAEREGAVGPSAGAAGDFAYAGARAEGRSGRSAEEISRLENERLRPDARRRSSELAREAAAKMQVKDFAGARDAATKALAADPENAGALVYRAMANNRLGDYSAAYADATEALRIAPMSVPSLLARAFAENRLREYPAALEDSNSALGREPRNSFAYLMRAYAEAGLGRTTEMRASLESAAAFNPAYRTLFERALQVPEGESALFLFEGDVLPGLSAAPEPPARRRPPWWPVAAAFGLAAAAWGLLRRRSAGATTVRRAAAPVPAASAPAGNIPSGYAVLRPLGAGGMGEVYEAKDLALDRRVAVKRMREELRRDPRERARFLEEARLVAKLRHPGIVEVYHVLEDASDVYLVFEYVEGRTLGQVLSERTRLSFREAKALLSEVCAAVEHAHAHGVVHRDLKPANIMLNAEGRAKVMDFGIARHAQEALTRMAVTGTVAGTPPYMAPEQELGKVGRESDVFALGVLLYEVLTGEQPFAGSPAGMLMAKREGRFQRASERVGGLPPGVDGLLARALAAEPDARLRSAAELAAELHKLG